MDLLRALLEGKIDEQGYVEAFRHRLSNGGYPIRRRLDAVGALRHAGYEGELGLGKWHRDNDVWRILWDVCFASESDRGRRNDPSCRIVGLTTDRPMR